MKKLFISCPMKGRTEENIRDSMERMHKIAESTFGEELELIPSYIEHTPPVDCKQDVWHLGESIKLMAEADYFIGVGCVWAFTDCYLEYKVAHEYGIPYVNVDMRYVMPDAWEIYEQYLIENGLK